MDFGSNCNRGRRSEETFLLIFLLRPYKRSFAFVKKNFFLRFHVRTLKIMWNVQKRFRKNVRMNECVRACVWVSKLLFLFISDLPESAVYRKNEKILYQPLKQSFCSSNKCLAFFLACNKFIDFHS